ncbi:MAG TPA: amidohydrolase family protein [Pyrinomonadaceae bacterium]|nr:amidohydrolase family protein [Pyrinomonadaceae bacterium]
MSTALRLFSAALTLTVVWGTALPQRRAGGSRADSAPVREVNRVTGAEPGRTVAIVGATLVDGRGGPAVPDSVVVVRGDRILAAGARASVRVPAGAEVFEARGMTVLPGLIDAHFHIDGDDGLPALFLSHGVTSLRDPGQWIEAYDAARAASAPVPRLFLTGPHLDSPPPAYPADSYVVRDAEEARLAVRRFAAQGASAFKVYFRLPVGLIQVVCEEAHRLGLPVTSHLEIVDAGDAIRAGVDGVEHVTSFGTAMLPARDAEKYRQSVIADNAARREGRYEVWSKADLGGPRARSIINLMVERGTYLSPTLAIFERRAGDKDTTDVHVRGFRQMLDFTARARRAGVRVVVGSHSAVPHAERGWAYQRELELLVEAGLTPMQAIVAATSENARFFRVEGRLGSVEPGKLADIVLVEGDPLKDIRAMRNVRRVMLGGVWVAGAEGR